jgi:hypothetical protein
LPTQRELGQALFCLGLGLHLGLGVGLELSLAHKTRPDNFHHILHLSRNESIFFGGGEYGRGRGMPPPPPLTQSSSELPTPEAVRSEGRKRLEEKRDEAIDEHKAAVGKGNFESCQSQVGGLSAMEKTEEDERENENEE